MKMVRNAAGRFVPVEVNDKPQVPFPGVNKYRPKGRKAGALIPTVIDYPADGNKVVPDLKTALQKCGLRNGMTISTHHHFREGDIVSNQVFDICAQLGVRNLMWFPSASFPCNEPILKHVDSGVVHHIEASMNGVMGAYVSQGRMKRGLGVLRSHGGRARAIQDGEVHIDIAVLVAPAADQFGNANGISGDTNCGVLGYAEADLLYADRVIIVTSKLVPFPCIPIYLYGHYVDYVVVQDNIGNPDKIVSGTTQITRSPDRLYIAELAARFVKTAGIMKNGFSLQAGAGGISLAFTNSLARMMKQSGIKAGWVHAGSTKYVVDMLEQGLTRAIVDGQAFDLEAVRSLRDNRNHIPTSTLISYNHHAKGNYLNLVDVAVLGATEVDVNFNANVVTHSDGMMLHGIGGWQNCMFAHCTILAVPSFRDRIPVIVDKVTTLCAPAEMVDVVVTERGIAINPRRTDLIDATKHSDLPVRTILEIKQEVESLCGKPSRPKLTDKVVAVVKWVDGTVLDSIYQVT